MRSDPGGSNESEPASEPDEFDSLVLDDDFVSAGIPEASLEPHERALPPTMRPRPAKRPQPTEADHPLRGWADAGFGHPGRVRSVGIALIVVMVMVASVVLTGLLHIAPLGAAATGAGGPLPPATDFAAADDTFPPRLAGLTRSTPLGTCFDVPATADVPRASVTPCANPHRYELVAFEQLTGRADQYPAASYWTGVVYPQCRLDLARYLGRASDQWPVTLTASAFTPSRESWVQGDRTVYCVADRQPSVGGSVRYAGTATVHSA
ncbi:Septum formation [Nakamurella panacisegetis]|uniref:Septum formation n=1 Tax=Nakamurella panacisegetis TaxID=1090615 RepID=A0A1H0QAX8_9ACTN|nr:septum formation family protein [Nakamurella panacisegetis]SDP14494.1 Septum formation [Nakamurella panacisegetis]